MTRRPKKLHAAVTACGILASTFMAQLAFSSSAEARCSNGTPVTSNLIVTGSGEVETVLVEERPVDGSCNGNGTYTFEFRTRQVGWRPSVWIQNGGVWTGHFGPPTGEWYRSSYTDNNSYSLIHLCLDNIQGSYYCGWGKEWLFDSRPRHDNYGVNSGF